MFRTSPQPREIHRVLRPDGLRRLALLGAYRLVSAGLVKRNRQPVLACNDARPIRSDFSDSELVECYKRYLPAADACSGGTSGLLRPI